MSDRYVFVYFMREQPDRIREVAPQHAGYWHGLELAGYLGGPFADRSGGAISFEAESGAEAERLVAADPFVVAHLLSETWLKQWHVE